MKSCPCGAGRDETQCCKLYIEGKALPSTPEALMRSRYTAYTLANIDYIKKTMRGKAMVGFHEEEARRWAKRIDWIKLHVLQVEQEVPNRGFVEFEAVFVEGTKLKSIHEKSEFICEQGQWLYVGGSHMESSFIEQIVSRSSKCPCGSPRKFKNCHGKGSISV